MKGSFFSFPGIGGLTLGLKIFLALRLSIAVCSSNLQKCVVFSTSVKHPIVSYEEACTFTSKSS